MFEARLDQGVIYKKLFDALKDLVNDGNIDCDTSGLNLQAMDSSHVSLVSMNIRNDGFDHYRCDRSISLGVNINNVGKILKCSGANDIITLKSDENSDALTFVFESSKQDKISEFQLKLMDIDSEKLGIPDTKYNAYIKMPSSEFQRICRDMAVLGDTITISASKEGVKFAVKGDLGTGSTLIKPVEAEKEEEKTSIEFQEEVSLNFALRYLNLFTKATSLSSTVTLSMSKDVPLVVQYDIEGKGFIKFYLAPKIQDETEGNTDA